MLLLKSPIKILLVTHRIAVKSIAFYCDKKDKTLPPPTMEEPVTIASKVIAKNPPVEELTHGRIFDPVTQTYRMVTVPRTKDTIMDHLDNMTNIERLPPLPITTSKNIVDIPSNLPLSQLAQDDSMPEPSAPQTPPSAPQTPTATGDGSADTPTTSGGDESHEPTPVPRLTRSEPERVMFCLIPYAWVKAFNAKTGVTGFWTFLFTYGTYLVSKEKLVMEHEYYGGLSMAILATLSVIYVGPAIAESLDKQIDAFELGYEQQRIDERQDIEDDIKNEQWLQTSMAEQLVVVQAKRDNVDLQLEAEFRQRQMTVYKQVKNMLDYQVAYDQVQRRFAQEQMVRWTINEVLASINEQIDSQYVDKCLTDLDVLSQKQQAN